MSPRTVRAWHRLIQDCHPLRKNSSRSESSMRSPLCAAASIVMKTNPWQRSIARTNISSFDQHIELRNEIEAFWWQPDWAVCDIPDPRPKDFETERLACLACLTKLLLLAFDKRIEMGLPRDAPPIFTHDMLDEWRAQDRKEAGEGARLRGRNLTAQRDPGDSALG